MKTYRLLACDGTTYESAERGTVGGYRPKKIYGRLDCPSALHFLEKGGFANRRVFFADEDAAICAGYRPCFVCMRERYREWKGGGVPGSPNYPWRVAPKPPKG